MKKFLLSVLTVAATFGFASAADVKDVITIDKWSETTSYAGITDKKFSSTAVYAGRTMKATQGSNAGAIQCQKNKHFLWTTASGGKIKSITVDYKSANSISVYASNTAYTTTNAGKDQQTTVSGDPVATLNAQTTSWTASATDDYKYIALVCGGNAVYLNSITIEWTTDEGGSGEDPEPDANPLGDILVDGEKLTEAKIVDPETQLTFSCANAGMMEVLVGDAQIGDTNVADNITWTAPADAGTYNLTVKAIKGSGETFSETSAEFTIIVKSSEIDPTPAPASDTWTWVKSTDGLDVGARYIIAYAADQKAISTTSGGNNRKTTSITLTEDKSEITNPSDNVMTFVLEKVTENEKDYYLWKSENLDATTQGYLYGPTGTSNHLNCTNPQEANLNKRYSTISISQEGDATITFVNCTKNDDNFVIKYNPSSNLFASYISTSTGMQLVQLYKAPASVKLLFHETTNEVGESVELKGESKKVHFEVADGVEVWHKFVADNADRIDAQAETDEDGFEKYDGNGVELTQAGELHYYTKTASGLKSTPKKLAVTGSTSAISEIVAEQGANAVIYDLQGRRVSRASKGIFIVNGKKELRK